MNLALLKSFEQNFPEEHDGTLDSASGSLTCDFNRMGTILAVGCNDGRIVLWDFITRSIAKIITAHVHPVSAVSWSRNGKKLASSSTDWTVDIWDVLSGECDKQYKFPGPLTKVQFHPRNKNVILVCSFKHAPVLIDMTKNCHYNLPFDSESEQNIVASFDRNGQKIYTGNAKGKIMIIEEKTRKSIASFRITTGTSSTSIKSIEFAPNGSIFLVNSSDRVIRVYNSEIVLSAADYEGREPESIQKLQDLVNRTQWKKCCFSGDGNYIVAGSARQHALSIWRTSDGTLVKILNGTKGETILDIAWHPLRAIIASIASGVVSIWSHSLVESWSAFAPDFQELDENVEYSEKEDEFDIEDEDKSVKAPSDEENGEDVEVDVTTVDDIPFLSSSCSEESDVENLVSLPVAPEMDDPENYGLSTLEKEDMEYENDRKRKWEESQQDDNEAIIAKRNCVETINITFQTDANNFDKQPEVNEERETLDNKDSKPGAESIQKNLDQQTGNGTGDIFKLA